MKVLIPLLVILCAGCSSIPTRCYSKAAATGGITAAGSYFIAQGTGKSEHYLKTRLTEYGDPVTTVHTRKTGWAYENRDALAIGTGLTAGAIALAMCAKH